MHLGPPRDDPNRPMDDDDFRELDALVEAHGLLDADQLTGLCAALATLPALAEPSAWLAAATNGATLADAPRGELIALMTRLLKTVRVAMRRGVAVTPPPEETEACAAFADGFARGAAIVKATAAATAAN